MSTVGVRYIVDDVAAAVSFYTDALGFAVQIDAAPGFAALSRDQLTLYLNAPGGQGGGSAAMPDGRVPEPSGWNRIQLVVDDLPAEVERLRSAGHRFRSEIVTGIGGSQILLDDPSGNPIELFAPAR